MMRWLKDKKKEKRTNTTSPNDGGKEDDYGFGKEKSASKSPSSRRQLPPTPATPEEKSPHIYEEIPDLPLCCMPDSEKALLQSKFSKNKNVSASALGAISDSSYKTSKLGASEKDDINPYMVVPVDSEVRQTPTDFHRNGTPEVHCDVIVKDTHCEILLSRKPKVGAFRLDSTALNVAGENAGERRNIRNNTHLCSRDRRAPTDVYSAGNQSSAFSVTSSAFSSSSASKTNCGGVSSSLTLGIVSEHHLSETCEDSNSAETGEKGVVTYSAASNLIPRTTKLIFNPLPGKNPRKEAFGSDSSDELRGVGYSSIKEGENGASSASFNSTQEQHTGSKCVTYASIQTHNDPDSSTESNVTYASVQDKHFADAKIKLNYDFDDLQSQFNRKQQNFLSNSPNDNNGFVGTTKAGIIRPQSPSNSSNSIYALVTFPTEPTHYNTIADINPSDFQENDRCHGEDFNTSCLGMIYTSVDGSLPNEIGCTPSNSEISDTRKPTEGSFSSKTSFHLNETQNKVSQASCFDFSDRICNGFNVNEIRYDTNGVNYAGITDQASLILSEENVNISVGHDSSCATRNSEFPKSSGHSRHNLELEFCFCSDEHSSSYGCSDAKHSQDDDAASIAGAPNDGPNSCRSCGRLIRQITYSESYSDETYEHVYASRLLIRSGRRYSSPDITFSEASNSEFQDIHNSISPDFPYAVSRDDSWTSTRNSDSIPPSYIAATDTKLLKSGDVPQLKEHISHDALGLNDINTDSRGQFSCQFNSAKCAEQNSSVVSKATSTTNTISCPPSRNSTVVAAKHSNLCSENESRVLKTENNSVLDIPGVGKSRISSNVDQSRSLIEPMNDQARKRDAVVTSEPKSSGFTGLLSKFARNKTLKSEQSDTSTNICIIPREKPRDCEMSRSDKDIEEIPEKNTKKLSKFFQRLSNKEPPKNAPDCVTSPEIDEQASAVVPKDITSTGKASSSKTSLENYTISANCYKCWCDEEHSPALHKGKDTRYGAHNCQSSNENCEKRVGAQTHVFATKSHNCFPESANTPAATSDQPPSDTASAVDKDAQSTSAGEASNNKPQFKTDSGDTCYEYDISTSSEGEQTGYEYFLSKVKKTLNLEHEVQHIAESSAVRRKRLCKLCKKEGLYSTIDEEDAGDGDGFCPHLAAKFGDLRAIFEDLVVDQRAAILDCLTDYTHSRHNIRGHSHEGFCFECGCEILTSDSESLTTVCSFLSHQFRMTSPNGQTLSCDSDEGTMADNSCESADDDCDNNNKSQYDDNKNNNNKSQYDDNSSGYNEPAGRLGHSSQRPRKKERKDKRPASSTCTHSGSKETETQEIASAHAFKTYSQEDAPSSSKFGSLSTEPSTTKELLKDRKEANASTIFSDGHRKNIFKKSTTTPLSAHSSRHTAGMYFSHGTNSKDDNLDHSKICDISRSRASLITDKVLQDIYAPLPSKAMSLLTSRNYGSPAGLSCTCGRGLQASLATMTAHLVTGETTTPPTGCIKKDGFLKPSSASLTHCDSDIKGGVAPVQKHSERDGKNCSDRELFIRSEKKDTDGRKSERHTISIQPEKEVLSNNSCSPTRKNAESNDCLAAQTKPSSCMSTKEWSPVPATDGSTLRNRLPAKQLYEPGIKSDSGLATSSLREKDKCAQMSLPHTTKDSADAALTSENILDNSPEHQNSENTYNDIYESTSVELKTESTNIKYMRMHRLGLVALDLLPESAVDGDATETTQTQSHVVQRRRSKVIEKMAKLFENNSDSISTDNKRACNNTEMNTADVTSQKNNSRTIIKSGLVNKDICAVQNLNQTSQECAQNKLISDVAENATGSPVAIPRSKKGLLGTTLYSQTRQGNLCARPDSSNLNFNENPTASDIRDLLKISKTRRSSSGSKQGKENETKSMCVKSDNESCRLKNNESKSIRGKTGTVKSSISYLTESRLAKQRSPTPSSSSVSSSSSSKRRNCTVKHKVSKKSYHRKRSKHRSERNKNGQGKEERTYYYFSSDFSDIDVVEVENCEPYNKSTSIENSQCKKLYRPTCSKKRSASCDSMLTRSFENAATPHIPSSNKNNESASGEQEIYALPSSSSELRSRKNSNEPGISPQPSPEMAKIRKMKSLDVYKSRKSNNKLLSDVIMRNYDMQVYGNV